MLTRVGTLVRGAMHFVSNGDEEAAEDLIEAPKDHFTGWIIEDSHGGAMGFEYRSAIYLHPQSGFYTRGY
jgi:hypothetical protein